MPLVAVHMLQCIMLAENDPEQRRFVAANILGRLHS